MSGPVPVVDVTALREAGAGAEDGRAAREALHAACAQTGFVAVTGHGAAEALADGLAAARRFFALPRAAKLAVAPRRWNPQSPNVYRGYFPSSVRGKEGLDVGDPRLSAEHGELLARPCCELNRFPEALDADWREAVARTFEALSTLGRTLVAALVHSLGGDPERVAAGFARPASLSTLRFNRYPGAGGEEGAGGEDTGEAAGAPPVAIADDDGAALACESHTDSGILTLLHEDRGGGLQLRDRDGAWRDVPFLPGALVVNTGLALQQLSRGALVATQHRVVYGGGERISMPFFLEPVPDFPVWPGALGLDAPAPAEPPTYERFLRGALSRFVEYERGE